VETSPKRWGGFFVCGEARPERKGRVVDLDHKATEDLAKTVVWSQDSLGYACEHGQPKLLWLLEAGRDEVDLEEALSCLTVGAAPGFPTSHFLQERGGYA